MKACIFAAALWLALPVFAQVPQVQTLDIGRTMREAAEVRLLQEQARAVQLENERRKREADESQSPEIDVAFGRFSEAIKYRRYRWDDFDRIVMDKGLPMTADMLSLMAESRFAADIAYYLGTHRDEAGAISQMALPEAGRAIFAIEKKLAALDN